MRLIVTPAKTPGTFDAALATGEIIVRGTKTPLADGARKLLDRGYNPSMPLTMRHAGSVFDSFQPEPIAKWAKTAYSETDRGLAKGVWRPFPLHAGGQKSGSAPEDDNAPPEGGSL